MLKCLLTNASPTKLDRQTKMSIILGRSPILAHLTESIKGLTTIRAFDNRHILHKEFDNLQNFHSSIFYMKIGTNRAFSIWLDIVCMCYSSAVTIMTIFQGKKRIILSFWNSIFLLRSLWWNCWVCYHKIYESGRCVSVGNTNVERP